MAESKITTGGQERIRAAVGLLSEAFKDNPTINYILDSVNPNQRDTYLPSFFRAVLTVAAANGATFDEIGRWKSCGVMCPPGSAVDRIGPSLYPMVMSVAWSIGFQGCQRLFSEMAHKTKACKAEALREGEKYFYVWFLGTLEEGRGQGLCSAVVRHYQARAAKEQAPIYLEAATEYCWRLYERLGFVTMGEMVLGEGKTAADGLACVGGPGVRLWSMIWRPEKLGG